MGWEEVTIGGCRLIRGDCLEVAPTLSDIHAVITDPPYGIGYDWLRNRTQRKPRFRKGPCTYRDDTDWQRQMVGDDCPFDPVRWLEYPQVILWGAQHFTSHLPERRHWLIWDKRVGTASDDQGDGEMAWTNLPGPVRIYRQLWRGIVRSGEENMTHGPKLHPTQKPIALMRWCVGQTTGTVLDPYAGSFTTALACLELGRPCVAIEIDPHYWERGCHRITEAYAQLDLFHQTVAPQPEQLALA